MHKSIALFALSLLFLSCGNKPDNLSEIKDASPADSMMYYFGQMQANNFWQDAESDTLLRTEKGREEFMRGFRAAMEMESSDDAYNKGLQLGLRLAIRLREFNAAYGMEFPEEVLAASLERSLSSDTAFNITDAQKNYYRIKDRLDLEKGQRESGKAKEKLAQIGKKQGFVCVSDTLYAKDITDPGKGPKFKDGDYIAIDLSTATLDGRELGRQFPDHITIGEGRVPKIICLATHTMTDGQTRIFLTTPKTLFGNQYSKYQLESDEPVIFTIKATRN